MEILTRTINIINRCTNLYRDTQLDDTSLSGCQVPYILRICRQPGQTQEELAQGLHVHKSSVARKLAALETNGWITRTPCSQDRRAPAGLPHAQGGGSHSTAASDAYGMERLSYCQPFPPGSGYLALRCSPCGGTALRHGPRKGGRTDAHSLSVYPPQALQDRPDHGDPKSAAQ